MSRPEPKGALRRRRNQVVRPNAVAAVIRVSKVYGRGGDSFMAPDEQRDKIEAYCRSRGIDIAAEFEELDAKGDDMEREGLQAALDLIYSGAADGLIVATVDRFSRSLVQGLLAVYRLKENNKAFIAVRENVGESARADKVLLEDHLKMAERQLEYISESWMETRIRFVRNGIATNAPFGYAKDPTTRRLVPDPVTAPWVSQIFDWRAEGWSYTQIALALDDAEVPAPRGGLWRPTTIKPVLERRTYRGELRSGNDYDGNPIVNPAAHEPLITEAQWEAAHAQRKTAPLRSRPVFLLAGLVRCASCGSRMTATTRLAKAGQNGLIDDRRYDYYRCNRRFSWGTCPAPARARAEDLEDLVLARFETDYLSKGRRRWQGERRSGADLAAALAAVDEAQAVLRRYMLAPSTLKLEASADPEDWSTAEAGKAERHQRVAVAKARLAALRREAGDLPGVRGDVAELWPALDAEGRRSWLALAFAVVAVRREEGFNTPLAERVRIWADDEDGCPVNLPGRSNRTSTLVPIVW